jgi:predicted dehydrogenase
MIKVGIIGYGKMGKIRHSVTDSIKGVQVISVYDSANIKADIEIAETSDQIINNPEIQAIFICTPNYLNKPLTIQSLKAGKHVFCEKPPAFTAKDVDEIQVVEKESNKVLMYGFNHRHHESIKEMKRIIVSGKFGRVLWMRGRYGKSVNQNYFKEWRSQRKYAGGGILIDQGIHMLDLFLYLGGNFDQVHAAISNLYWKLDVEDNVFATLKNSKSSI